MRARTRGRELALQFLFQVEFQGEVYVEELQSFLDGALGTHRGAEEAGSYARRLVEGVMRQRDDLDTRIQGAARNWQMDRMAAADRTVLRIGCYELLYETEVPVRVALNEAIELAKQYSTEASGAFVNGILDRIRKDAQITR